MSFGTLMGEGGHRNGLGSLSFSLSLSLEKPPIAFLISS